MNRLTSSPSARTALIVLAAASLATAWVTAWGTDWSQGTLTWVIDAGLSSALLATVVLAINVVFRHWLTARQMGLLWGLVLARLLVPVGPPSAFSLQNVVKHFPARWIGSTRFEARTLDPRSADSDSRLGNASQVDPSSADA